MLSRRHEDGLYSWPRYEIPLAKHAGSDDVYLLEHQDMEASFRPGAMCLVDMKPLADRGNNLESFPYLTVLEARRDGPGAIGPYANGGLAESVVETIGRYASVVSLNPRSPHATSPGHGAGGLDSETDVSGRLCAATKIHKNILWAFVESLRCRKDQDVPRCRFLWIDQICILQGNSNKALLDQLWHDSAFQTDIHAGASERFVLRSGLSELRWRYDGSLMDDLDCLGTPMNVAPDYKAFPMVKDISWHEQYGRRIACFKVWQPAYSLGVDAHALAGPVMVDRSSWRSQRSTSSLSEDQTTWRRLCSRAYISCKSFIDAVRHDGSLGKRLRRDHYLEDSTDVLVALPIYVWFGVLSTGAPRSALKRLPAISGILPIPKKGRDTTWLALWPSLREEHVRVFKRDSGELVLTIAGAGKASAWRVFRVEDSEHPRCFETIAYTYNQEADTQTRWALGEISEDAESLGYRALSAGRGWCIFVGRVFSGGPSHRDLGGAVPGSVQFDAPLPAGTRKKPLRDDCTKDVTAYRYMLIEDEPTQGGLPDEGTYTRTYRFRGWYDQEVPLSESTRSAVELGDISIIDVKHDSNARPARPPLARMGALSIEDSSPLGDFKCELLESPIPGRHHRGHTERHILEDKQPAHLRARQ